MTGLLMKRKPRKQKNKTALKTLDFADQRAPLWGAFFVLKLEKRFHMSGLHLTLVRALRMLVTN